MLFMDTATHLKEKMDFASALKGLLGHFLPFFPNWFSRVAGYSLKNFFQEELEKGVCIHLQFFKLVYITEIVKKVIREL